MSKPGPGETCCAGLTAVGGNVFSLSAKNNKKHGQWKFSGESSKRIEVVVFKKLWHNIMSNDIHHNHMKWVTHMFFIGRYGTEEDDEDDDYFKGLYPLLFLLYSYFLLIDYVVINGTSPGW